jgi:hypothetical protein
LRGQGVGLSVHSRLLLTRGVSGYGTSSAREPLDILAIFEGCRLVGQPLVNSRFDELAVSPSRRYLAVHGSSFRGLSFLDSDGRLLARSPLASGHHVAWSPDDRWTVVATGGSTYLFRTAELEFFNSDSRPPAIQIPVHAEDLEWR